MRRSNVIYLNTGYTPTFIERSLNNKMQARLRMVARAESRKILPISKFIRCVNAQKRRILTRAKLAILRGGKNQ